MYILRVVTTFGIYRYAYGKESEALKSMRKWAKCPSLIEVQVFEVGREQTCERP